jgi:hypothetical protein
MVQCGEVDAKSYLCGEIYVLEISLTRFTIALPNETISPLGDRDSFGVCYGYAPVLLILYRVLIAGPVMTAEPELGLLMTNASFNFCSEMPGKCLE